MCIYVYMLLNWYCISTFPKKVNLSIIHTRIPQQKSTNHTFHTGSFSSSSQVSIHWKASENKRPWWWHCQNGAGGDSKPQNGAGDDSNPKTTTPLKFNSSPARKMVVGRQAFPGASCQTSGGYTDGATKSERTGQDSLRKSHPIFPEKNPIPPFKAQTYEKPPNFSRCKQGLGNQVSRTFKKTPYPGLVWAFGHHPSIQPDLRSSL